MTLLPGAEEEMIRLSAGGAAGQGWGGDRVREGDRVSPYGDLKKMTSVKAHGNWVTQRRAW